jgi:hypothetical protein
MITSSHSFLVFAFGADHRSVGGVTPPLGLHVARHAAQARRAVFCQVSLCFVHGRPENGEWQDNNGKPIYFDGIDNSAYVTGKAPHSARDSWVCCVRRDKAALSSGCKAHPATAPAGSNRSSPGGNEVAEAFG